MSDKENMNGCTSTVFNILIGIILILIGIRLNTIEQRIKAMEIQIEKQNGK